MEGFWTKKQPTFSSFLSNHLSITTLRLSLFSSCSHCWWLLHCCLLSAFVITRRHATANALFACHFCHQSSSTAAMAADAAAARLPLLPPPPPWSNSPSSIAKERGNSSSTIIVPMAAPTWKHLQVQTTWTYLTYLQYLRCVMLVEGI